MKDAFLLLVAGLAGAGLAWAFWHFLGSDAITMLVMLTLVVTLGDNVRLRRKLRELQTSL